MGQQQIYGGAKLQLINISCHVDAYPPPVVFQWAFNTSSENVEIPNSLVSSTSSGNSIVSYTPLTAHDFGSLLCWASNNVGKQQEPCVYQVVPASPPEAPQNCSTWQETAMSSEVIVSCRPGWDGGLPQNFSLEVRLRVGGEVGKLTF